MPLPISNTPSQLPWNMLSIALPPYARAALESAYSTFGQAPQQQQGQINPLLLPYMAQQPAPFAIPGLAPPRQHVLFQDNSRFAGAHPRLAGGLENAFLMASQIPTGMTPGENISNVARAMVNLPMSRLQIQMAPTMMSLQMQEHAAKMAQELGHAEYFRAMAGIMPQRGLYYAGGGLRGAGMGQYYGARAEDPQAFMRPPSPYEGATGMINFQPNLLTGAMEPNFTQYPEWFQPKQTGGAGPAWQQLMNLYKVAQDPNAPSAARQNAQSQADLLIRANKDLAGSMGYMRGLLGGMGHFDVPGELTPEEHEFRADQGRTINRMLTQYDKARLDPNKVGSTRIAMQRGYQSVDEYNTALANDRSRIEGMIDEYHRAAYGTKRLGFGDWLRQSKNVDIESLQPRLHRGATPSAPSRPPSTGAQTPFPGLSKEGQNFLNQITGGR